MGFRRSTQGAIQEQIWNRPSQRLILSTASGKVRKEQMTDSMIHYSKKRQGVHQESSR